MVSPESNPKCSSTNESVTPKAFISTNTHEEGTSPFIWLSSVGRDFRRGEKRRKKKRRRKKSIRARRAAILTWVSTVKTALRWLLRRFDIFDILCPQQTAAPTEMPKHLPLASVCSASVLWHVGCGGLIARATVGFMKSEPPPPLSPLPSNHVRVLSGDD